MVILINIIILATISNSSLIISQSKLSDLKSKKGIEYIKRISIDNYIVISTLTSSLVDSVINLYLYSIKPFNITNYMFISTDNESFSELYKRRINVMKYYPYYDNSKTYDLMSRNYCIAANMKQVVVLDLLKIGLNVYLFDSDIVFKKNPLDILSKYEGDMIIGRDGEKGDIINSGA